MGEGGTAYARLHFVTCHGKTLGFFFLFFSRFFFFALYLLIFSNSFKRIVAVSCVI